MWSLHCDLESVEYRIGRIYSPLIEKGQINAGEWIAFVIYNVTLIEHCANEGVGESQDAARCILET